MEENVSEVIQETEKKPCCLSLLSPGTVWKENDNRFSRYVRVEGCDQADGETVVAIRTIHKGEFGIVTAKKVTYAKLRRFGASKGYRFIASSVEDFQKM